MSHPKRGPQAAPTKERRQEMLRFLDDMAQSGDTNAAGWLLALHEIKQNRRTRQ